MANLYQQYVDEIRPRLKADGGYANVMQVPRLTKVTLNMGVGEAVGDRKIMEAAVADLALISGQKPIVTNARKSEAGFKIREGWPIGCKVTLRRERMYEFIERLIGIAIPPRLPRAEPARLRRPWQLLDGLFGADRVPGDRLRQDRPGPRAQRHDYHYGGNERTGAGTAARVQLSVPQLIRTGRRYG